MVTPLEVTVGTQVLRGVWKAGRLLIDRRRGDVDKQLKALRGITHELDARISRGIGRLLATLPKERRTAIRQFLDTEQFISICGQAIALRVLYGLSGEQSASRCAAAFEPSLRLHIQRGSLADRDLGVEIMLIVVDAIDAYVETHTKELARLTENEQARRLLGYMANIDEQISNAFRNADPFADFLRFITAYRSAGSAKWSRIRVPTWESDTPTDKSLIYIDQRFKSYDARLDYVGRQVLTRAQLPIERTVVLGDPGAGKSTFATTLALEILNGARNTATSGTPLPFLLTLRDLAQEAEATTLTTHLERSIRSDLQMDTVPRGLLEFLMTTGGGFVIFDGLDELTDPARRVQIVEAVEAFAERYPLVGIVATSRLVGYKTAPLDASRFASWVIQPFRDPDDVNRYAHAWFTVSGNGSRRRSALQTTESFMSTTESIADLRSNPFLLALLCNLYQASGYQDLPRTRAGILEKCALTLYDRWDRRRGLANVDFERDFLPTVAHLAFQLFTNPSFAKGVGEPRLIQLAVDFLYPKHIESEHAARSFARSLIAHCEGRAWVFTDVGADENGQAIYDFTHRTFLEYFCALHIVRTLREPAIIASELRPHIVESGWGQVPMLCLQIVAQIFNDASDDFLVELLAVEGMALDDPAGLASCLEFALAALDHVNVSPAGIRLIVEEALRFEDTGGGDFTPIARRLVSPVKPSNQPTYRDALTKWSRLQPRQRER